MFFLRHNFSHPAFLEGLKSIASVCPGIFAWGLMTGVAMVNAGLSVPDALAMTLLVFAGSSQLAVLPLLAVHAPLIVVLATAFCVNLRFVVFSAHLQPYLAHYPRAYRLCASYFTGDISYVQFMQRFATPALTPEGQAQEQAFLAGNVFLNWACWMTGSIMGVLLTQYIPIEWGVGFAGILALVGLTSKMINTPQRGLVAVLASIAACLTVAWPLKLNILFAMVVSVAMCLILERLTSQDCPRRPKSPSKSPPPQDPRP